MPMSVNRLYRAIEKYIADYVPDPLDRGHGFVYPEYPRNDATLPRIFFTNPSGGLFRAYIGRDWGEDRIDIDIGIRVPGTGEYTIGGLTMGGSELLTWYMSKILDTFRRYKKQLKDEYGVSNILLRTMRIVGFNPEFKYYEGMVGLMFYFEECLADKNRGVRVRIQ